MNKTNIDQALAALADALKSDDPNNPISSPAAFARKLPERSLSGNQINGGKIANFSSTGITDQATKEQIVITDKAVSIQTAKIGFVKDNLTVEGDVVAKTLKADVLEVKEIKADIKFEKDQNIEFGGKDVYGKGIVWKDAGNAKQFVFQGNPDRFFSSETIDINRGRHLSINGIKVLDDVELGASVTKSNLRELGRLKGLIVDGSVKINNYLFYNGASDRLGLGIEEPNAGFSVAQDAVEVMIGTRESTRGMIGTYAGHGLDLVTDNTMRIGIGSTGNIQLGNTKQTPVQVSVHGKLAIKVAVPDPEVDLHVSGSIKFNGKLHKYDVSPPSVGAHNPGDIIWNTEPQLNSYVGWVCVQAGDPGVWQPFGKIGN